MKIGSKVMKIGSNVMKIGSKILNLGNKIMKKIIKNNMVISRVVVVELGWWP